MSGEEKSSKTSCIAALKSLLPWNQALPKPLGVGDSGYLKGLTPTALQEEHLSVLLTRRRKIDFLWTPETNGLQTVHDVPALRAVADRRAREHAYDTIAAMFALGTAIVIIYSVTAMDGFRSNDKDYSSYIFWIWMPFAYWIERLYRIACERDAYLLSRAEDSRYRLWLKQAPSTWTLILVLCFLVLEFTAILLDGASASINSTDLSPATELIAFEPFQRLEPGLKWLTGSLAHNDLVHLIMNSIGVVLTGRALEALGGRHIVPLVFVGSCIAALVARMLLLPDAGHIGASGGLFGMSAYLMIFGLVHRQVLPRRFWAWWFPFFAYECYAEGASMDYPANPAHIGGFLGGLFLAVLLVRPGVPAIMNRWISGLGLLCGGAVLFATAVGVLRMARVLP